MREVRRWAVSRYAIGLDISVFISITIIDLFAAIKISTLCIRISKRTFAFPLSWIWSLLEEYLHAVLFGAYFYPRVEISGHCHLKFFLRCRAGISF